VNVTPAELEKKDDAILAALSSLRASLGDGSFVVVDHWPDDPCAIGIASTKDPSRLVYVASTDSTPGLYYAAVEFPPSPGSELPYAPGPSRVGVRLSELASLVADHLRGTRDELE
jgi:hypothetical protein